MQIRIRKNPDLLLGLFAPFLLGLFGALTPHNPLY